MAQRGRKKMPENIKKMKGTDQKCRSNSDAPEIKPVEPTTEIKPPSWLKKCTGGKYAAEEFKRVAGILQPLGVLTDADITSLAIACQMFGEYIDNVIRKVEMPASKYAQMRMFYSEFGLTPSSRQGIKVEKNKAPENRFSRNGRRD